MDPLENPFSPGAGSPPPELVEERQSRIFLGMSSPFPQFGGIEESGNAPARARNSGDQDG